MTIRAAARALAVFDCFEPGHTRLTLNAISKKLKLAKSTTFRLVHTLVDTGFLIQLEDQTYCLSLKIMRLSGLIHSTLGVREIALPEMRRVNTATGETVALSVLLNTRERVVVDVVESQSALKLVIQVGETINLKRGAVGRAFLAYHPEIVPEELFQDELASGKELEFTEEFLTSIRAQGYAFSAGMRAPEAAGIAVPIFDMNNVNTHCLSISGPEIRVSARREEFSEILKTAGGLISDRLGSTLYPAGIVED